MARPRKRTKSTIPKRPGKIKTSDPAPIPTSNCLNIFWSQTETIVQEADPNDR